MPITPVFSTLVEYGSISLPPAGKYFYAPHEVEKCYMVYEPIANELTTAIKIYKTAKRVQHNVSK